MMKYKTIILIAHSLYLAISAPSLIAQTVVKPGNNQHNAEESSPASAATILAKAQVPILCYHQIRDWRETDSKVNRDYITPVATFKAHMKMLADSDYHAILPDQLYAYLNHGTPLPSKPIMLSFDDSNLDQYTVALPVMKEYGFKGVFFIMTVALGKKNYMSKAQLRELSDAGHLIGHHTWDHSCVTKYQHRDWLIQIEKQKKLLQEITGKDILYFAYPYGLWNPQAIPELKKQDFLAAFQLADKQDSNDPLFTIRRIIASGYWSATSLHRAILKSF